MDAINLAFQKKACSLFALRTTSVALAIDIQMSNRMRQLGLRGAGRSTTRRFPSRSMMPHQEGIASGCAIRLTLAFC